MAAENRPNWGVGVFSVEKYGKEKVDPCPSIMSLAHATISLRMHELFDSLLPYLSPSEQAVYLRLWRLSHGECKDHCAIRYDDLATLAYVSRSTLKRTLKKLSQRKLVKVEWSAKRASVFTVFVRRLSPANTIDLGITPKLYDLFEEDDRSLFLSCKRALSPKELKEIEDDAGDPRLVDVLIFRRAFGPERQRKYEALVEKFTR